MVNVTIHAHSVEEYGHGTPDKLFEGDEESRRSPF